MKQHFQRSLRRAKPVAITVGKFAILTALRYGPAGVAGWAVKSVARRPLKLALGILLEPALVRLARRLNRRFNPDTPR
ncbi:phage shock protein PspD [Apirhabdus apintestini]|uniref:phage shock protein PspD n=1 Tax=Erwinia sp. HR93 TaxID=3094840 RepID=UPI002ADEC06E|nr:phage shock protein PspD [Erwinia sp. HR93]MEA1064941.1 phage shock protein PspD [Erwinia sp. HR93]WPM85821.1 phage shock protein PspD [Enterobacteriaceae bacterium CA-0114]